MTALNIELKNHPLKEENAQLKKRLQEEQQRAREELKRIRHKNLDLMSKMNSFTASAAISNNSSPDASKPVATVETQTESLIEEELKKTNDKLQDCMQICRHRFNHIKQLEEKLKQNENNDTSNITSLTTGHINLLKVILILYHVIIGNSSFNLFYLFFFRPNWRRRKKRLTILPTSTSMPKRRSDYARTRLMNCDASLVPTPLHPAHKSLSFSINMLSDLVSCTFI